MADHEAREEWDGVTVLAPPGVVHLDPAVGGPPLVSGDGHWRWCGDHWEPVHHAAASA